MDTSNFKFGSIGENEVGLMAFSLKYDVPLPLEFFRGVISRSAAFRARKEGKLVLELVVSKAAVRPSELARYLNSAGGKFCFRAGEGDAA